MDKIDLKSPKVQAWIMNCCLYGITTNFKTSQEIEDFTIYLIQNISNLLENVWMKGDEDGVLCEDSNGNPFAVIMFSPGLLKFKSLISETNISEEFSQLIGRTILSTIALLVEYIGEESDKIIKPAGGLFPGNCESHIKYEDDGFGIT